MLNAPPNPPYEVVRGGGAATVIPGWPANTHCFTMTGYKYYLVAGGVYGPGAPLESLVMWSDAAEPGALPTSWTPRPDNDAGDLSMADFAGPILAAHALSDALISTSSGVCSRRLGGRAGGDGAARGVSRSAVWCAGRRAVMLEREHVVATAGDLILHDGAQMRSLIEGRFRTLFRDAGAIERVGAGAHGA